MSMQALQHRRQQAVYWTSVGWDCLRGAKSKSVYVLGHSKSGTNWLCHLVSGVLSIPFLDVRNRYVPRFGPCVLHVHRIIPLDSVRHRTIYIMRDGRDVMVSLYFHVVRRGGPIRPRFERATGRRLDAETARENLPDFIRFMQTNRTSSVDYRRHLEEWGRNREKYVNVRYEDLLERTVDELSRVITEVTGSAPSGETVKEAVQQQDFARLSKRDRGVEDSSAFLRKGIQGDWRNYFSPEAARVFDAYAGDLLVELGYERDRQWILDVRERDGQVVEGSA